jgi:hypothetical protein
MPYLHLDVNLYKRKLDQMPKCPVDTVIFGNCVLRTMSGCSHFSRTFAMLPLGHAAIYRDADEYNWRNKHYVSGTSSAMFSENNGSELLLRFCRLRCGFIRKSKKNMFITT